MKYLIIVLSIFVLVSAVGCADINDAINDITGCDGCDDDIDDMLDKRGAAEEIDTYDTSDGYHSWTYWYWCSGISYTFTWEDGYCDCDMSIYTFSPICM